MTLGRVPIRTLPEPCLVVLVGAAGYADSHGAAGLVHGAVAGEPDDEPACDVGAGSPGFASLSWLDPWAAKAGRLASTKASEIHFAVVRFIVSPLSVFSSFRRLTKFRTLRNQSA